MRRKIVETNLKPQRPAFLYYGGKWNIASWIIQFFPKHNNYLEVCGGAGSVLIRKEPSKLETFNDIDKNICNFFRILRDQPELLFSKIRLTPYAREEFEICREPSEDPVENARRLYCSSAMSISNTPFDKHTGMSMISYYNQIRATTGKNFSYESIKHLILIAKRFEKVQIENRDCGYVIQQYDKQDTLIYFDPPYVKDTRVVKTQYINEVDDNFHIKAAELLNTVKGFVVVSGYQCKLYKELYEDKGWTRFDKQFQTGGGKLKTESIWISPNIMSKRNQVKIKSLI